MWVFTRYGFFSVGNIFDMAEIRARREEHLANLIARFQLTNQIVKLSDRDYAYRIVLPKEKWAAMLAEMATEQTWSNFKDEAARNEASVGRDYVDALHVVWSEMLGLQEGWLL